MRPLMLACAVATGLALAAPSAQQAPEPPRPIDPGGVALPPEAESEAQTRFSFIAYGDTRGQADGSALQIDHGKVVDAMIATIKARASGPFPVRFIVQSGDGVTAGSNAAQWNVSYTPLVERLLGEGGVPYFLAVGNHDVTARPIDDPQRQPGLRNTLAVMSKIYPPDGSPRRLDGYPTFAFGYGNVFVLCLDSNIAVDRPQLEWVDRQLDGLDRARYRHVIAVVHHPVLSSGPHGGPIVESQTATLRQLYMPLFRRHHLRLVIAGHDHLFEHWVERYTDATGRHRLDEVVTGGGGAPIYTYRGEPDLADYLSAGAAQQVSVEHLVKPGPTVDDNPHHFVVVQVDGDSLSLEVVGIGPAPFLPYGRHVIELADPSQ
ncbi:MAG: hypothetical protein A3H97_01235 [Acidobacteria bacterium RIFCSPLOWO2_02_FULL_65_29]|nr:MAG: hypothetical protein A3H97_01235 [Acidobacteria bacterium RIFCSPLOWO2_02_FULL_65_29]